LDRSQPGVVAQVKQLRGRAYCLAPRHFVP